jgi:Domain of unknown function (DUF222)
VHLHRGVAAGHPDHLRQRRPGQGEHRPRRAAQEAISGGHTEPVLPLLGTALDTGGIGVEQTRIIVGTMRQLPAGLDPELRQDCQRVLVEQRQLTTPEPFARLARAIALTCNPDGDHDDRDHTEKVDLTLGPRNTTTGMSRLTGHLDDEGVEILTQAITATSSDPPSRRPTSQ